MEGKIYEAINKVMSDIGVVQKNGENTFDKYKYRRIDDVMNALNPAMVKNHVFVTPTVLESTRQERQSQKGQLMMYTVMKVKYTFYTDDGSSVECVVIGEAMDRSDKSTNKAMATAFKYACFQTFCIPTEEMHDTETESPDIGEKTEKQLNKEMAENVDPDLVPHGEGMTEKRIERLRAELKRTGHSESGMLGFYKLKDIKDMNENQYITCISQLMKKEDKK